MEVTFLHSKYDWFYYTEPFDKKGQYFSISRNYIITAENTTKRNGWGVTVCQPNSQGSSLGFPPIFVGRRLKDCKEFVTMCINSLEGS